MTWKRWAAGALGRYAVGAGEWVRVESGFVLNVDGAALMVDGVLSLDGVCRV